MERETVQIKPKTKVFHEDRKTVVRLYSTDIVKFNDHEVILSTGGWDSPLTGRRMNEASKMFGLGFHVFKKNHQLYCITDDGTYPIENQLTLIREWHNSKVYLVKAGTTSSKSLFNQTVLAA